MAEIAVVGLGNPLAGDEGIGGRLAEELERRYDCSGVEVYDLGTSLFNVVHVLENKAKAVIIDCALMGEKPGTIIKFTRDEARSKKVLRHMSLHEGDVFEIVNVAGRVGSGPPEIVFFGIEPERIELGRGLSASLECRFDEYLKEIASETGLVKKVAGDA
ncbi:MAG: hydrogenase maturation protease [Spirochaetales bacterium]|nr:hydrogenase maturation protease [Spirochaetales bacterium]